jgi:hypothetical protein
MSESLPSAKSSALKEREKGASEWTEGSLASMEQTLRVILSYDNVMDLPRSNARYIFNGRSRLQRSIELVLQQVAGFYLLPQCLVKGRSHDR